MKRDDLISYVKILLGSGMVSPLVYAGFRLDISHNKALLYTIILYTILMAIAIPMFNYLEYGKAWPPKEN